MTTAKTIVIFGGEDFESVEARKVALQAGLVTGTATLGGKPVHGNTAYKADGFVMDGSDEPTTLWLLEQAIIFECAPACVGFLKVIARCDHHNPGDAGYGEGPKEFFKASSLGQLMVILGVEPSGHQKLVAASDHCPAAAYRGLCPGISPEAFVAHRVAEKVAFYATIPKFAYKANPETLELIIAEAMKKLCSTPMVDGVRDLRGAEMVDELPEAALRLGQAYMAELDDTDRVGAPTGNRKIVLGGHTAPAIVNAFMAWANALPNKVGGVYGNPTRGFAGVVVKP